MSASSTDSQRRRLGPAWHRRVAGLHVMKVAGSQYEMGRQHGALVAEDVARGPLGYYRRYVQRIFAEGPVGPASPLVWAVIRGTVGRKVAAALPPETVEGLRGLADGSGLPMSRVLDGAVMPDSLVWLVSRLSSLSRCGSAAAHRATLGLGCTSALAWGSATADGRLLHARNFDYHGVRCWPATAAVIFFEPDDGQRFVAVTAAGVPTGGITAMNESGLTLTVHQHMFTDRAALGGVPVGAVGDRVMRNARNLDEAEEILDAHPPIGCWTYLVADGNERELLCHEQNPERRVSMRVREPETGFGYANVFLDPALGATEKALYGSYWRANTGRHRRVNDLLGKGKGDLGPSDLAAMLGDSNPETCRVSDPIANLMTVGSVVFRPEDGALWVGAGPAPTSHGSFEPFSLRAEDHAPELGAIDGSASSAGSAREAFEAYRLAFEAWFEDKAHARARAKIERARELAPGEPLYHCAAGLMALRCGDASAAAEAFDRALELGHAHEERVAAFHLWRGRAADLLGERAAAKRHYRACLRGPADGPVHRAAKRGVYRRYTRSSASRFAIDFTYVDVMAP
jgi:hypothetical protein